MIYEYEYLYVLLVLLFSQKGLPFRCLGAENWTEQMG